MIKTENEVLNAVNEFRKNWKSTKGRKLAIGDKYEGQTDSCIQAYRKAYAPSVRRALVNPNKINTKAIISNPELECYFVVTLERLVYLEYDEKVVIELATKLRNAFREAGITDYTYGNAFKHITVAVKYVLSANGVDPLSPIFKECFVPLDRIVQQKAMDLLGVQPLKVDGKHVRGIPSWGKCDNINDYIDFQRRLKESTDKAGYYSPLMWEIENW